MAKVNLKKKLQFWGTGRRKKARKCPPKPRKFNGRDALEVFQTAFFKQAKKIHTNKE